MNTMHMPGFTAEEALGNVGTRHQANTRTSIHTGLVQPADSFSDSIDEDMSFASLGPVYVPRPIPCLRWECIHVPNRNPFCYRTLGFWNPVTKRCE